MTTKTRWQESRAETRYWGAVPMGEGWWDFALWAPSAESIILVLDGENALEKGTDGTFRGRFRAEHGACYALNVDGQQIADPASRWQACGVTGASRLLDPARISGPVGPEKPLDEAVIAEVHIGSFTPEGSFAAAACARQLRRLADLGFTMVELMPLGQFPGARGWGYDPVLPFAPHHTYGQPGELLQLVDAAHDLGLQVCLDVVFNHFGPEGCALTQICPEFFHSHSNEWGRAINYDQAAVRDYFKDCAIWWLEAYGIDALRFDALHALEDGGGTGMAEYLASRIRAHPFGRKVHLIAEDSRNIVRPYLPENRLYHAVWNDDYHHAQHVLLTGETFGYYRDFRSNPLEDMARALREGYALQGQPRASGKAKGEPSAELPPQSFVAFNLNHDHAGNRPQGDRLLSLIGQEKAKIAHALLLTSPSIPLLFMGEEIGSEACFPWFADYAGDLAATMAEERAALFTSEDAPQGPMVDPFERATMEMACPYRELPARAAEWQELTRHLITLRRKLLPIWRSGRIALPDVCISNPSALAARSDFRDGSITAIACFDARDRIAGSDRPDPLFRIGAPLSPPFFGVWLDLSGSGDCESGRGRRADTGGKELPSLDGPGKQTTRRLV